MIKRTVLILLFGATALAIACSGGGSDDENPAATATSRVTVSDPTSSGSGGPDVGPDGDVLPTPQPDVALTAALASITGFDITDVTFRGDDVTVKYDQVVNEPPELLLMRWIDFASVAVTFLDSPRGDVVLVPQVENADIASVRLRAVHLIDYLDGKRALDELLAGIEIN